MEVVPVCPKPPSPRSVLSSDIAIHIKRPDLKDISEERKQRDTERIHIPIDFYNIEILNNKDLETFFNVATTAINNILNYGTDK